MHAQKNLTILFFYFALFASLIPMAGIPASFSSSQTPKTLCLPSSGLDGSGVSLTALLLPHLFSVCSGAGCLGWLLSLRKRRLLRRFGGRLRGNRTCFASQEKRKARQTLPPTVDGKLGTAPTLDHRRPPPPGLSHEPPGRAQWQRAGPRGTLGGRSASSEEVVAAEFCYLSLSSVNIKSPGSDLFFS